MAARKRLPKMTEGEVLALLRRHYVGDGEALDDPTAGNGAQWAFVPHVRRECGTGAERTIDALAWGMWKSRGLSVHAHEVKCSRADWRTELRNPAKADAFHDLCDYFWLVVAHESFVQPGELPETWGLMHVKGGRIHVMKEAPRLRPASRSRRGVEALPPGWGRSSVAALLRSAVQTKAAERRDLHAIREAGHAEGYERARADVERAERDAEQARAKFAVIEKATGIDLSASWYSEEQAAQLGRALRVALSGEVLPDDVRGRLERQRDALAGLVEEVGRVLDGKVETRGRHGSFYF